MIELNLGEVREWLEILYGDTPGKVHICGTHEWTGKTFATSDIDGALAYVQDLDRRPQPDDNGPGMVAREGIYLRATTLRADPPPNQRGGDDLSFYLPGLWADIDIAGPGHKTKNVLPPNVEVAVKIVRAAGLPDPSHWIHSGGGLYPWWILKEAAEITDLAAFRELSATWQQALAKGAQKLGYHYGSGVGDLSRVLRIPGTVNRKAGMERPCTGLGGNYTWNGPRYTLEELCDAAMATIEVTPEPEPIHVKPSTTGNTGEKPGDEFNRTADWHDILLPHGWDWVRKMGDTWYLRRPGKTTGTHSATLRTSTDCLYVFSEEAHPFEPGKPYTKFAAYAVLEHHGDFSAAARELRSKGYGAHGAQVVASAAVPPAPAAQGVPVVAQASTQRTVETGPQAAPVTPVAKGRNALGLPAYGPDTFSGMSWDGGAISGKYVDLHKETFAYVPADNKWMMWDGVRWGPDVRLRHEHAAQVMVQNMLRHAEKVRGENEQVGNALVKETRKLTAATQIASIIRNARSHPDVVADHEDFDQHKHLMTLDNGVLDLTTGALLPHDPSLRLTRKMNAALDPSAPQGRWYQFMTEVLPDQEVRSYVQRVCGYMLTGEMTERVIMLLYGESGTGKTQFLEALHEVMGDFGGVAQASAFQPRQQGYKGPTEDLHKLRGTRLAIQSELDAGSRLNEALVKSIVGADTQSTRPLYGAPVDWQPEFTAFLATNHLPRISSSENAIWNRVKPIEFSQVFIDATGQARDPNERSLGRRIAKTEASSILNWLLEGLAAYREMGLAEPAQVTAWMSQYREEVDTCRQFLTQGPNDGQLLVEPTAQGTVREIYGSYTTWCRDNGIMPLGLRNFNARLESAGYVRTKRTRGIMWSGLGLPAGEWLGATQGGGFRGGFQQRE